MIDFAELSADGLDPLLLTKSAGYNVRRIDFGSASTRFVHNDAPGTDGMNDDTELLGHRVVTMTIRCIETGGISIEAMRRRLRQFTRVGAEQTLRFQLDGESVLRATMRRGNPSMRNVVETFGYTDVVMQWVVPTGLLESDDLVVVDDIFAVGAADVPGREYPLTFPRSYPAATPSGRRTVTNDGDAAAYPILRLYGPQQDPVIERFAAAGDNTASHTMRMEINILAGEYLEIDTRTQTVLLNGSAAANRFDTVDQDVTTWPRIEPGDQLFRLAPETSFGAAARLEIRYRHAHS